MDKCETIRPVVKDNLPVEPLDVRQEKNVTLDTRFTFPIKASLYYSALTAYIVRRRVLCLYQSRYSEHLPLVILFEVPLAPPQYYPNTYAARSC